MYTLEIRNAYFPETTFLSYCGARNRFGKDRFRNKRRSNGGEEGICTDSSSIDYAPIQCGNVTGKEEVVKGFVFPKVCETLSFNYNEIVFLGRSVHASLPSSSFFQPILFTFVHVSNTSLQDLFKHTTLFNVIFV